MQVVKDFFAKKTVGFYLGLVGAVLSLFMGVYYAATFRSETAYFNDVVWILPVVGGVLFCALSIFDVTAGWAPVAMGLGALGMFTSHLRYVYMYFTNIFFNGVTFDALMSMNFTVTLSIVGPIICMVLAIVGMYSKQNKEVKNEE